MALTEEQKKKKKELEAKQAKAIQKAASAFKSNPSSIPKKYQSQAKETSKKQEKYSSKTAKKNYSVGKNGSIKAKATKATKNYISGKSSNASGKKLTGAEKLRNSPGWNMTQEERFLKQRQYNRTKNDMSADKLDSKTWNAKDEAETRYTITGNYAKYAQQTARQAKENAEKYQKTGDAKYLDQAKEDANRARVFQQRMNSSVGNAIQAEKDFGFYLTSQKYDQYTRSTNPEYKAEAERRDAESRENFLKDRLNTARKNFALAELTSFGRPGKDDNLEAARKELKAAQKAYDEVKGKSKAKAEKAEAAASDTYTEMFKGLKAVTKPNAEQQAQLKTIQDEAERLAGLTETTETQQAEIQQFLKKYKTLPKVAQNQELINQMESKSGTATARVSNVTSSALNQYAADVLRVPGMVDDAASVVMDKLNIDDTPNTDRAKKAEEATARAIKWMDKAADKFESKASENREEAERGLGTIGKMGVDLGITLTQIGADAVSPIGALESMATRVAGGVYNQVKESGADTDDALLNAGMHAAVEVLTERMFGLALPVYGRGSVDALIEKAINKAAARVASKAGRRATKGFFRAIANFATEGGEELIAAGFDPIIDAVTVGDKSDMKRYGTQEFWDDAMYQMVLGGVAGFVGGSVNQIARGFEDVDEKTLKETRDKKAAKNFVPVEISDFSQSLINNGIKSKAAVNADTIISNLVDNEAEVTDKEINKMLDDLHITKKGAKTSGAQRNLTALKNRLGLTDLDSNISRADLVKAIREGARIAKQNKDMQTEADVRGMEEQAEAEQVRAEVDDAEQDISNAERSQQTITIGDETLTHDQYAERMQAVAEANGNVLTDEQINTLWDQAVSEFGTPVEEEAPQQIEGQMDLFGEMGRTDEEEAKFLEDTFGIKRGEDGQMNMFDAMDEDTLKEQVFGIKKQKDEMETLAEETQRKQNSVLEKNEAADKLAPETQEDLNTLAGNIGYRIEVHDHIPAPKGAADMENAIINGYIDKDTGTIHIAMDATDDIETTRSRILKVVAIHETTHGLETLAPEEYQAYSGYVENNWDVLNDGEDFATALENKMKQYADAGQDIGEVGARQELMAEFASHMDQDAIFDFVNSNPTIGQKIVDMFREIVSRLKETFGMAGDAETALRKWERAYQAAAKNTVPAQDRTAVDAAYRSNTEVVDNDGEPVAFQNEEGTAQFSLSTYATKGRDVLNQWLNKATVEGDLTEDDANAIRDEMERIYTIARDYADSGEYLPFTNWSEAEVKTDKDGNILLSAVTPNNEYVMNLDLSLVCKKRQTLDHVLDAIIKKGAFNKFEMGQEDIANINRIIVNHGFETECAICFVGAKRFRQAKIAGDFADQYNALVRSMMPEGTDATYFNFGGNPELDTNNSGVETDVSTLSDEELNLDRLRELADEVNDKGKPATKVDNKIARYLLEHPEGRHLVDRTDLMTTSGFEAMKSQFPDVLSLYNSKKGSGGPKASFGFTQYFHEMLSDKNFNRDAAYAVGGVRIQSFSDYVPRMFFDYAEIVGDLAAKKLPSHAYTKEADFVKMFGLTGIKINMSLVPASKEDGVAPGLDKDGNYLWEKGQTFDYDTAVEIQKADGYTNNCGTIAVGVSDAHIRKMLDDPNIRMIIPYHKSSLNPVVAAINNINDFTNYESYQNTRYQNGTKLSASDHKSEVNFNELMHEQGMTPKEAAEAYVRWCEENDYLPKFDQFAYEQDENGDYIVEDGQLKVNENYYKLLEDFTLYNENGDYVPQGDVQARFPGDEDAFGNTETLLSEALKADTELDEKQQREVDALADTIINTLDTPAVRDRISREQIKAKQDRGDELRAAERERYNSELEKRRAAVKNAQREAAVQRSSAPQYSLTPVPPVQNTSDSWRPGATFDEVKAAHPNLYDTEGTEEEVSNKTQIQGTKKTYDKVFQALMGEDFDGSILDASSGLGLGTELGKEYGLDIEDIEPYPNLEKHTPDYTDYSTLNKKYDFIISNAVLNVVPQDQRDALVVKMGELLNDGGRMFINVRGKDVLNSSNKEAINEDLMEYYIPGSRSYQKGFTRQELKAYLEDALGDGYRVETDMGAFKTSGVPVLVYKEGTTEPSNNRQFSIGEKQNSTDEILQKMYESLGLSPNAQPMTFAKETKQSKVNANTFTNTTIFDDAMQYARNSNERIKMQTASDRIKEIGEYDVVSEQESMARAKERLEADYQGEVNKLILEDNNNEEWGSTDLDVAMGIMHTELAHGDIDAFYDAAKAVQEKGTKAGQLIQAFAKYSRTPEGVAVQALDDIEEKLGKIPPDLKERIGMLAQELRAIEDGDMDSIIELIKKQAKIRKTPIGKHTINQLYKETYQANYDRAVTQLLGIAQDEEAKHIKADAKSIGQKISTWQLVSHLLNLRTGARNVVSNTVFGFAETIANDLALVPDFLVSLGTGNRTVGGEILTPKALAAGVARARSSAIDIKLDVAPDDSRTKYGNTRRTWKMASRNPGAKAMSVLEMLMGYELNVTDEFAKGMHEYRVRSGLQKWVDAGMYDEKTVDQFAEKEMLYRTFQDDTFPGVILGGIKKGLNVIGFGHTGQYLVKGQKFEVKQFGMGDLVQKYTQVPGALLARLVEYSPAGYAKAIYNLGQIANAKAQLSKEGKKNRPSAKKTEDLEQKLLSYQRELSLSMGRATTGAGFIQMFFALAASGLLHDEGSEDDDDQAAKNEAAIRALQGISGTQLNLSALGRWIDNHNDDLKWKSGDTLINIDFLEPMNGLMSIAAVLAQDEYFDRDDIDYTVMGGDILHSIVNSFAQVPTMQSIQNIQNAVQYHSADSKYRIEFEVGLELLKGSVTGFVPGPVRQAAQYQDDYYRETYGSNDPIEQMRDALKNSIPGQRQTLDTKLTPYGTDKEMEDRRMRALNAFVNPGKLSEYKESELESILSDMGAAKLYPTRKAPNKLGFGNGKKLTPSEKRMYLETMGQTYTEEMNKIISTDAFKNASKGEQRDRLLEVKTFADQYAKTKIAENLGTTYGDSDTVDKTLTAIDKGIDLPQWIDYKSDIKGLNAKDKNGNSVDGLKKERTVAVIADMDISDEAKDYLYVELQKSNNVKEENLLKGLEKTPWHGGSGKFTK